MKPIKNAFLFLAVGTFFSACSQGNNEIRTTELISASVIVNSNLPPADKAEELANAAEKLLTAQGFMEASELAALALKQDPTNLRAGFIKALTGPLVLQKGIVARLRPLAEKSPAGSAEYNRRVAGINRKFGESSFKKFLFDGKPDIRTEEDFHAYGDALYEALDQLRTFTRKNTTSQLTIKATTLLVPDLAERYALGCDIKVTAKLEYEVVCPPSETRNDVTLNRADFAELGDMASYAQIYLGVANAYNLSGSVAAVKAHQGKSKSAAQVIAASLFSNSKFGHLRSKAQLTKIKSLGLDVVSGMRWATTNQAELCPKGYKDPRNRPGMWMNTGICVYSALSDYYQKALDGEPLPIKADKKQKEFTSTITPMVPLTNPISDLRAVGPYKFDKCGHLVGVGDPSLGGLFPSRDANEYLLNAASDCETK